MNTSTKLSTSQKGITMFSSHERGLAPILIVLLIATVAGIGGYLVYQKQTKPIPSSLTTQSSPTPSAINLQSPGSAKTANWKIYKNEEYGFEIKYPSNWFVWANPRQDNDVSFTKTQRTETFTIEEYKRLGYEVRVFVETKNTSLDDEVADLKSQYATRKNFKIENTIVDGKTAFKLWNIGLDWPRVSVMMEDKGRVYAIQLVNFSETDDVSQVSPEAIVIFDQILSTFKFLP